MNNVLQCRSLNKSYRQGPERLQVLSDLNLSVAAGERLAIIGQSGAGKTTLLNMLGGLDQADSGEVLLAGEDLMSISEARRCQLRNRSLGFVYQLHHLLGEFSALENAAMPLMIRGDARAEAEGKAEAMLQRVGLGQRLSHRPAQLSGGERQRVAIARALVTEPACVLMDEPTGNLDTHTAASVQELLMSLNQELNTAVVLVTHDQNLAAKMGRVLQLDQGQLIEKQQVDA